MSLFEGLASTLADMGFVQLSLVFLAVSAYSLAINGSLGSSARGGAASLAFVSAVGFSALTPSFMSGVVFLALGVFAVAAFAATAWAVSALLGLGSERGVRVVVEVRATQPMPLGQPVRALGARAIRPL